MAENQDVNTLKRRGRRRLVGAIALVLASVIVLPMVFDSEPKGSAPPVSVRIPGEDDAGFTPKVTPKSPPIQEQKLAGEQFMVPAGAYADPAGILEKLKEAKIPYYTEPIATKQGTVTRVRAGPFASRDAADKALQQLKGLGLKPGNVATKT